MPNHSSGRQQSLRQAARRDRQADSEEEDDDIPQQKLPKFVPRLHFHVEIHMRSGCLGLESVAIVFCGSVSGRRRRSKNAAKIEHHVMVRTLHQKRTRVWFEFPEEIPLGYEIMMQMLLENVKIKILYRGILTLVYIYTNN